MLLAGIDEVGTGSAAGSITFGLAVVPDTWSNPRVKDSKKYSGTKRATAHQVRASVFDEVIRPAALFYLTASASAQHVDRVGSWLAQKYCMEILVSKCRDRFPGIRIIMDGENRDFGLGLECHNKADQLFPVVSAASVLAKTTRDRVMKHLSVIYPGYGFERNSGYLTEDHLKALQLFGPCDIHRRSVVDGLTRRTQ